jgi:hypothetical protein
MTAYNIVRMRVKPGREEDFLAKHRVLNRSQLNAGLKKFAIVKTGDRSYCIVGEWDSFDSIVKARPTLIALLDGMRDMLEDLGGDLGVTDPVSGEAVVEL